MLSPFGIASPSVSNLFLSDSDLFDMLSNSNSLSFFEIDIDIDLGNDLDEDSDINFTDVSLDVSSN